MKGRKENLAQLMKGKFPPRVLEVLRAAGGYGEKEGYKVFAVGGFVRDLILGYENLDIDLVVEGEGMRYAQGLAASQGASYKCFERFGTAAVYLPSGIKFDVATARQERYERPAALPRVRSSSIRFDLYRRDFTINSLAIDLTPGNFGELVDFFGGEKDLNRKLIRVLHKDSFVDDPTRAFRAVRFSRRYGFRISGKTKNLILAAVSLRLFDRLSGKRLFAELKLLLAESRPVRCIKLLHHLGLLTVLHPCLGLKPESGELFKKVRESLSWLARACPTEAFCSWLVYLLALVDGLNDKELKEMRERSAIGGKREREALDKKSSALATLLHLDEAQELKNSQVYGFLKEFPLELLLYMMARSSRGNTRGWIRKYIVTLRKIKPYTGGKGLIKLGLPPGPRFGQILSQLLRAKLDGQVVTKADEIRFIKENWPNKRAKG